MQNFGIYIIGDEILSGKREDKHLTQAIQILKARGLTLAWAEYLGDDPSRMIASFKRSFSSNDIVFSFGGIGATPDDYTRQAAADALEVPIVRHQAAVAEIEAQFGEGAYPKRVIMADFPQGAGLIPNPVNRVAGFSAGLENKKQPNQKHNHYFVPGFPDMAHPMMEWVLDTHYSHLFHQAEYSEQSIIIEDGIESQLIDLMNKTLADYPDIKVFSLPKLKPNRQVELGAKGEPEQVKLAMQDIKIGVSNIGFSWVDGV
ncbi:MAG: competence/damage-inducible protein A [Proteobacteria bacterium ST_bin12]|nr:MAG: competence/damage-inducible protein A [Proteobacteria bacterium ST_bin12]